MLRDILILGVIAAVVIILLRLILGAPILQRIRETFVSGPTTLTNYTECPSGSVFYMYGGKAFCCSGNIDPNAITAADTCKIALPGPSSVFCTLGPTTNNGIVNCVETAAGLAQADQDTYCSPTLPNFAPKHKERGACCETVNADGTGCTNNNICLVGGDPDLFNNPLWSCELFKAQYEDGGCPNGYVENHVTAGSNSTDKVKNLYYCANLAGVCFQKATIDRLQAYQYDTSNLTVCPTTSSS